MLDTRPPEAVPSTAAVASLPRVFEYADYRAFLRDWTHYKKMSSPAFSGAVFARRARLQSHTLLGLVIRGQRNLTAQSIRAFVRALDLTAREALFFEKLVLFNQSKDSEDKAYYFEQLHSVSQGAGKRKLEAIRDYANYLKYWYIPAVRELVLLPGFKPDAQWISERLKSKITRSEAQAAWKVLLELGFVRPGAEPGQFVQTHPRIDIAPGDIDFVVRNYHRGQLKRGQDAIDGEPYAERHYSSLTLSLSGADYQKLQERIEDFRKTINLEFPSAEGSTVDRVVVWNSQLIQLSEGRKE